MPSSLEQGLLVALSARTRDPFDAAIRLLGDAQRYGFELEKLDISKPLSGEATVRLVLRISSEDDIGNIRDRFSRHAALSAVVLHER